MLMTSFEYSYEPGSLRIQILANSFLSIDTDKLCLDELKAQVDVNEEHEVIN